MVKKKILILGSGGMLGHLLFLFFLNKEKFQTFGVIRKPNNVFKNHKKNLFFCDLSNFLNIKKILKKYNPDFVINCCGIIKQNINDNYDKEYILKINSHLPQFLNYNINFFKYKLIHISTDCIFAGDKGNYDDNDVSDATDIYGISKRLGEVISEKTLTLRTSIIGHEISNKKSLLEWFLQKKKKSKIQGYTNAYFSGLTTLELSKIIFQIVSKKKIINGIFNVSSQKISKYHLLKKINKIYKKNIFILKTNRYKIDRSLNSKSFKNKFKIKIKNWDTMIKEMRNFNSKLIKFYE